MNLPPLADARFAPFRLRPGEDASCLNLYEPRNPRILGASREFLRQNRFAFAASEEGVSNPWLILEQNRADGAIPAIADANSIAYVLHRKIGDEVVIGEGASPVRLRLVAALRDSLRCV